MALLCPHYLFDDRDRHGDRVGVALAEKGMGQEQGRPDDDSVLHLLAMAHAELARVVGAPGRRHAPAQQLIAPLDVRNVASHAQPLTPVSAMPCTK